MTEEQRALLHAVGVFKQEGHIDAEGEALEARHLNEAVARYWRSLEPAEREIAEGDAAHA